MRASFNQHGAGTVYMRLMESHGKKWGCHLTWRMMIGKGEGVSEN